MLVAEKSLIFSSSRNLSPYLLLKRKNGREFGGTFLLAKRKDMPEDSRTSPEQQLVFPLRIRVSNTVLARAAVAVFGLGFIDAGYSGDWSRIGAISKESEELLKISAFLVVPFCLFLIFSFSKEAED
ncbi:hypothetical protein ACFX13_010324 [Malus domestica]|uniref:uncharacterized protein LOC126593389 n=1 Tax=Malus sylvestris TaxID=3752 RepID=UPI0021AC56E2|nr:uncharacterized protein LOC126593389 [Malus sylvestris]